MSNVWIAEGTWLATLPGENRLQFKVTLRAQTLINAKPQQPIGTGTIVYDD